jgi:aryl sulfotransferase
VRYQSSEEDSARWQRFTYRPGDIVISTRSKSGTTWVQTLCALLVFQSSELPAPLSTLSPWLDWLVTPWEEVSTRLAAQRHRRFIKTHTPLDGIPMDSRVTYIVVARHPLDAAVSLYHQADNLDRARIRQLVGLPRQEEPNPPRLPLRQWLLAWIDQDADPRDQLDSLPGFMWHLSDAWLRRHADNVLLLHYDDLLTDRDAEMRRLADHLAISVPEDRWPELVDAAGFHEMRGRAAELVPDPRGVLKDSLAFFRHGRSGAGRQQLSPDEIARYRDRTAKLAPPDLLAWLHRDQDRV